MSKKLISLKHYVRDYECMWSGIEDLYSAKLGEEVPAFTFFCLSGAGNFIDQKAPNFRNVAWSHGMVDKMYDFVGKIARFSHKRVQGWSFYEMIESAKKEIDEASPMILGPLDMYYLKYYPKIYKHIHIPIHFVTMIGYDEEGVYLLDGGIADIQHITYEELQIALDIEKSEVGDKNGLCYIHLNDEVPTLFEIVSTAWAEKAKLMLEPKAEDTGIAAMRNFAEEFPKLQQTLSQEVYMGMLTNMTIFSGTVPQPPARLTGAPTNGDVQFKAMREKLVEVLNELGKRYNVSQWLEAAELFEQSGKIIEKMVNQVVDYLLHKREDLQDVPKLILEIADLEEHAYKLLAIKAESVE